MIRPANATPLHRAFGTATTLLVATTLSQSLWAVQPVPRYEMSFVANKASGELVAKGRYLRAIDRLSGSSEDSVARGLNLCVAETLAGLYRDARRSCNRVVEQIEQSAGSAPAAEREQLRQDLAHALSNRGVLRAIRGQAGAADDFQRAMELGDRQAVASRNLTSLKATGHNAQTELAAVEN